MNPEIKAKWIDALRSGKYKQGQKRLRDIDGSRCCLGVLCDVMGVTHTPSATHPPREVWKVAGLGMDHGPYNEPVKFKGRHYSCLVALNDGGADFNFIADVIEKQL